MTFNLSNLKQKLEGKKKPKYVTGLILLVKSSKIIKAIKLLKFAKPLIAFLSIVISLFAYSMAYGISLAIALVALIFVHELGHVIAINKLGFKAGRMVFIPFIGAMIAAPRNITRRQEAIIGIGGPALGSVFAALFLLVYYLTNNAWFLHAALLGFMLNLFNMLPVGKLDGGRVTQIVGKWFNIVGLVLLIGLTLLVKQPTLLLIWIIAFVDFDWFNVKTRLILVFITIAAMVYCLITGYGFTGKWYFWYLLGDIVLGIAFLAPLILKLIKKDDEDVKELIEVENRPPAPIKERLLWLAVWIFTTGLLVVALITSLLMIKNTGFIK